MSSGIGEEEARFITEFVVLGNYPDATITESKIEEGMQVNSEGVLVHTTSLIIKACIPTSCESITIDLKIFK